MALLVGSVLLPEGRTCVGCETQGPRLLSTVLTDIPSHRAQQFQGFLRLSGFGQGGGLDPCNL